MFPALTIALLTVVALLVFISILLNTIQIKVMKKMSPRLQVVDIPTYNLSIFCLVCSILSYPTSFVRFGYGIEIVPNSMCPLMIIIPAFTAIMINLAFLVLAIERYLSVVYPLFHRRLTTRDFKSAIYCTWIGTSFFLLLIVVSSLEPKGCQRNRFVVAFVSTSVILSIIATISVYLRLFRVVRKRICIRGNTAFRRSKLNQSYITFTMYVIFVALWLPANIGMFFLSKFPNSPIVATFGIPAILAKLSFMSNTLTSLRKSPGFRKQFISYFRSQKNPGGTVLKIKVISRANFSSTENEIV